MNLLVTGPCSALSGAVPCKNSRVGAGQIFCDWRLLCRPLLQKHIAGLRHPVGAGFGPCLRSFSEHPFAAGMAGMAAALMLGFLTFEATREDVTTAIITSFAITVFALAAAAAWLASSAHREEIFNHRRLRRLGTTDALTGLANWKCLETVLTTQWSAAQRKRVPLSVIFVDIDYFKRFNDTLGHEVGDEVLRTVAAGIFAVVAQVGGFVARYGGDEFGVVLGNISPAGAERLAWALRRQVQDMRIQTHGIWHCTLTVSVGCVTSEPPSAISAEELMEAADQQLNAAKEAGRDRVCTLTLNSGAT